MSEKLRALYEKVSGDDSLKEAFRKGLEATSSDDEKKSFIVDFAKEQGITLTEEDFSSIGGVKHLSDEDLEKVVGGIGEDVSKFCGETYATICKILFATSGIADGIADC